MQTKMFLPQISVAMTASKAEDDSRGVHILARPWSVAAGRTEEKNLVARQLATFCL